MRSDSRSVFRPIWAQAEATIAPDHVHTSNARFVQVSMALVALLGLLFVTVAHFFGVGNSVGTMAASDHMSWSAILSYALIAVSVLLVDERPGSADGVLRRGAWPKIVSATCAAVVAFFSAYEIADPARARIMDTAAIGMLALSLSVLVLRSRVAIRYFVSQAIALLIGMVVVFVMTGYVFGVERFYRLMGGDVLAPQAALVNLALVVSILASQTEFAFLRILRGSRLSSMMGRRMAAAIIGTNMVLGGLALTAEDRAWMSGPTAIAFMIAANTVLTLLFLSKTASAIDAVDSSRRGTERLLVELVKSTSAAVGVKDLRGRLLLANDAYERQFRRDDEGHLSQEELRVIRTGEVSRTEERLDATSLRSFLVSRFPIYDERGRLIGVATFGTEITDVKKVEEELRRSEEGLRTLADTIPSIVWTANTSGKIDYFNRRWEEYTGRPVERSIGDAWIEIVHPDDVEITASAWNHSMRTGRPFAVEHRMRRSDGSYRWHLVRGSPLKDVDGRIVKWFGSSYDIDDQKRWSETLEKRVSERTDDLTRANRELEAFNYSVSHDLRAPLRSVDGFSQILLDRYGERLDEKGRSYLGRVRAASRNMASLIDDLLTLSRIGRTEVVRETVDLSRMASEILGEKTSADPYRKVDVVVEPGMVASADESLIRIALTNLLDNAWKYSAKVERSRIEFFSREEKGGRVFVVRDNGAGFDMAHAGQLFKAFQRLHDADQFPGTGIGLVIAQRVIERHGGTIRAEAEPGKGASFIFSLGETKGTAP